jgi:hypothetical protein
LARWLLNIFVLKRQDKPFFRISASNFTMENTIKTEEEVEEEKELEF